MWSLFGVRSHRCVSALTLFTLVSLVPGWPLVPPWQLHDTPASSVHSDAYASTGIARVSAQSPIHDLQFGMTADFSGQNANMSRDMKSGIESVFGIVNSIAGSGIQGHRLSLTWMDDKYDPPTAIANTQKMIAELPIMGMLGTVGTPTTTAILPVLTAASVPCLAPLTGSRALRHPFNANVINVRASYDDEVYAMVQQCIQLGRERISIFWQNDGYGKAGITALDLHLKNRGLSILSNATYERNTLDVELGLAQLTGDIVPQAVILVGTAPAAAKFVNLASNSSGGLWSGLDLIYFSVSFVGAESFASYLLPNLAVPIYVTQVVPPYYANEPSVIQSTHYSFVTAFQLILSTYNTAILQLPVAQQLQPSFAMFEGFAAGVLVYSALTKQTDLLLSYDSTLNSFQNQQNYSARLANETLKFNAMRAKLGQAILNQGMHGVTLDNKYRIGPFGIACTAGLTNAQSDSVCSCNQGMHHIYMTKLNATTRRWLEVPQFTYKFPDCGEAILDVVPDSKKPIVFGHIGALTGVGSSIGSEIRRGIRAAFREYNVQSGIGNRQLTVLSYDDQYNPALSATLARRILVQTPNMFGFIGPVGTATAAAILPIAYARNLPIVGPRTGATAFRAKSPFQSLIINLRASYTDELALLVQWSKSQGHTRLACLYQNDAFGTDALTGLKLAIDYYKLELIAAVPYTRLTTNMTDSVLAMRDAFSSRDTPPPETIFMLSLAQNAALFIAQLRSLEPEWYNTYYLALSSVTTNDLFAVGRSVGMTSRYDHILISQPLPNPFTNVSQSLVPQLLSRYVLGLSRLDEDDGHVSYDSLEGYLTGILAAQALDRALSTSRADFVTSVYSSTVFRMQELTIGPYVFSAQDATMTCNQGGNYVWLTRMTDAGKVVDVTSMQLPSYSDTQKTFDRSQSLQSGFSDLNSTSGTAAVVRATTASPTEPDVPSLATNLGSCGVLSKLSVQQCSPHTQKVSLSSDVNSFQCRLCPAGTSSPTGDADSCVYPTAASSDNAHQTVQAFAALGIVFSLITFYFVFQYRTHASMRAASPNFLFLTIAGSIFSFITAILWNLYPPTDPICTSIVWMGHLGFSWTFIPLLLKTIRLVLIFNRKQLKFIKLSDSHLFVYFVLANVVLLIFLSIWSAMDAPKSVYRDNSSESFYVCESSAPQWTQAAFIGEAIMLIVAAALAYAVRNNPSSFNESKFIALALYNTGLIAAIVFGIVYLLPNNSAATRSIVPSAGIIIAQACIISLLLLPKVYAVYNNIKGTSSAGNTLTHEGDTTSRASHLTSGAGGDNKVRTGKRASQAGSVAGKTTRASHLGEGATNDTRPHNQAGMADSQEASRVDSKAGSIVRAASASNKYLHNPASGADAGLTRSMTSTPLPGGGSGSARNAGGQHSQRGSISLTGGGGVSGRPQNKRVSHLATYSNAKKNAYSITTKPAGNNTRQVQQAPMGGNAGLSLTAPMGRSSSVDVAMQGANSFRSETPNAVQNDVRRPVLMVNELFLSTSAAPGGGTINTAGNTGGSGRSLGNSIEPSPMISRRSPMPRTVAENVALADQEVEQISNFNAAQSNSNLNTTLLDSIENEESSSAPAPISMSVEQFDNSPPVSAL